MGFDLDGFTAGYGAILVAFFFSWAFGIAVKVLNYGGD